MNVVNCSTRLPPVPPDGGIAPYEVIVKEAGGQWHHGISQGMTWNGSTWNGAGQDTVVAWVDPIAQVLVVTPFVPLTSAPAEDPLNLAVTLTGFVPASKIGVIKLIRELTGLGLGEAKAFVEASGKVVKDGLSVGDAAALKAKIEAVGGVVTVTPVV